MTWPLGSTPTVPIFYENGPIFNVHTGAQSIASFTSDSPLLSGWILGGKFLKGTSVIAEQNVALLEGKVDRIIGMHAGKLKGEASSSFRLSGSH